MKELVEKIVRALVDSPEEVRVREIEGTYVSILEIRVARHNVTYLLGEKGKNIDALRTIITGAGKGKRHRVKVIDPWKSSSWQDNRR